MNKLGSISGVHVETDCYLYHTVPSRELSQRWLGKYSCTLKKERDGYVWKLYFLQNLGVTNGFAFPPGTMDLDLPQSDVTTMEEGREINDDNSK